MSLASSIRAGGAFVEMMLQDRDFAKGLTRVGAQMRAFGSQMQAIGRQGAFLAMGMAAPFSAVAKTYGYFTRQLGFVSTMLDNSAGYINKYSTELLRMSVIYGDSTESLSKGLYDILSAGFKAGDALRFLKISAESGVAGMSDTRKATEALIAVLHSYGKEIDDLDLVSQKMFMSIRRGVLTFDELAGHIGLVASTAALAGVSLSELLTSIAIMTGRGVQAEHAIIAINNVINTFMNATDSAKATAKEYASALGDMELSMAWMQRHGLSDALARIVEAKNKGELPEDAIAEIFTTLRSKRGIFPLVDALAQYESVIKSVTGAEVARQEAMSKVAAQFGHFIRQLTQMGSVTLNIIGEVMEPHFRRFGITVFKLMTNFTLFAKNHSGLLASMIKGIPIIVTFSALMWGLGKAAAFTGIVFAAFTGSLKGALQVAGMLVAFLGTFAIINKLQRNAQVKTIPGMLEELLGEENVGDDTASKLREVKNELVRIEVAYGKAVRAANTAEKIWNKPGVERPGDPESYESYWEYMRLARAESRLHENWSNLNKERLVLEKKLADEKARAAENAERQAKAEERMKRLAFSSTRLGMYAGAWGRPKILFAGAGAGFSPELNRLSEISKNTKETNELLDGGLKIKSE